MEAILSQDNNSILPFPVIAGKYVSDFCGKNDMKYKWKEIQDPGCLCCKWSEVKET